MMKRFRIAILSLVLLSTLLAGCASNKSAATDPDEGSAVRSKEVGSAYEGSAVRSKEVGSQENTDISADGDIGVE